MVCFGTICFVLITCIFLLSDNEKNVLGEYTMIVKNRKITRTGKIFINNKPVLLPPNKKITDINNGDILILSVIQNKKGEIFYKFLK